MDIPRSQFEALSQHGLHLTPESETIRLIELTYESPIRLWENSSFYGRSMIGAYSFVNKGFSGANISIGRYCSLASYVREIANHQMSGISTHPVFANDTSNFFPGDHVYSQATGRRGYTAQIGPKPDQTQIGHDVWIGEGAMLMNGIRIGNGSVVGANTFVRTNVPPYSLVVGCPGRVVKQRFSDKLVERLERVQWWNYDISGFIGKIDVCDVPRALDVIEEGIDSGHISILKPDRWVLQGDSSHLMLTKLVEEGS